MKAGAIYEVNINLANFYTAVKVLEKYPKPKYIVASPPCESWVKSNSAHKAKFTNEKGLNLHWKTKWVPFDFTPQWKAVRMNGVKCAITTAMIIQHFKPKFWAIENPRSSLIFSYIAEHTGLVGYNSLCNYFSYGFTVLKNTIIFNNANLILKNEQPKYLINQVWRSSKTAAEKRRKNDYVDFEFLKKKNRSLVPVGLYKDIIGQFEKGGQETLFPLGVI